MSDKFNSSYFLNYLQKSNYSKNTRAKNPHIYKFWVNYLQKTIAHNLVIFEVGCGLGYFGVQASKYWDYHAIDISSFAVSYANETLNLKNVRVGDANKLDFPYDSIDAILSFDLIEHLDKPEFFIREAGRVLKPGGLMILSTPNPKSYGNRVKDKSGNFMASMYRDTTHVSLWEFDRWKNLITKQNFEFLDGGTDALWDIPYSRRIPLFIQKAFFIPISIITKRYFGFYSWRFGENSIFIFRKTSDN